ncbi:MAG: hypothetical protein JRJ85_06045 [Deltaproteobacteria bacterium]|nr:hypothetical protein [Deltaproteobacteria bacterium]
MVCTVCDMGFDQVELVKRFTAAGTGPSRAFRGITFP